MDITIIGGGPAGLYFSLLMKRRDPAHGITLLERNGPDDTFGWGVVFSDETLDNIAAADPESYAEITRSFAHWDDDRHPLPGRGADLARPRLLRPRPQAPAQHPAAPRRRARRRSALQPRGRRVEELRRGGDLVLAADGVNSQVRSRYADAFRPALDWRPNKFIWLGTTRRFDAFTFIFEDRPHGLWSQVHAYQFDEGPRHLHRRDATEATWRSAGLEQARPRMTRLPSARRSSPRSCRATGC